MRFFDSFILSSCLLCNGSVRGRKPLCAGCEKDFPWNHSSCSRCAIPSLVSVDSLVCATCLQDQPLFQRACCAFRYEDPVASLLNRYKHNGQLACGYWLAQALADVLDARYREANQPLPDCILPVPLHWRRLRQRGFDQGLEIGKVLSSRLGIPLHDVLRRRRHTQSQQALSRVQRQQNLAGAFDWSRPVAARCVALVDDVLTTGSTANEITAFLGAAGVQEVHVWAIARTP